MFNFFKFKNTNFSTQEKLRALLFFFIFLIFLCPAIDPDFGWHLQTGRYILQNHRVPAANLYSYNFPNFKYADFYWAPQAIFALVVDNLGLFALSILCALVMTVAVFIAGGEGLEVRGKSLGGSSSFLLAVLLSAILIHPASGVRPLVFGSLFFAIFLRLFLRLSSLPTSLLTYLPTTLLFLLWSNFYGDFLFGVLILWGLLLAKVGLRFLPKRFSEWLGIIEESGGEVGQFLIAVGCTIATLMTPNGFFLWRTLFSESASSLQLRTIVEWLPLSESHSMMIFLIVYLAIVLVLLWKKRGEISLSEALPILVFAVGSVRSAYFMRFLALASVGFLAKNLTVSNFLDKEIRLPIEKRRLNLAWLAFFILLIFGLSSKVVEAYGGSASPAYLAKLGNYPFDAVEFLKKNPQKGRVFNTYAWGGYLAWQMPEIKLFIFGNMSAWKEKETEILYDYKVLERTLPGFTKLLKKYNISWVFLKPDSPLAKLLRENRNWSVVYEDKAAVLISISPR